MKRRSWLWFLASAILAVLAGVLVVALMRGGGGAKEPPTTKRSVVVASQPIAADSLISVQNVEVAEREEADIPDGAVVNIDKIDGWIATRDIGVGEVIVLYEDVRDPYGIGGGIVPDDKMAVALPADDILSSWGAILPGDHVDVLFTIDVLLETPMYLEDVLAIGADYQQIERDQSLDNVSVLTLQNLEVLRILEEPQVETEARQQDEAQITPPKRALLLKIDPQDAVVLKYLRDSVGHIDLALRAPDNEALFSVEPVNINYLVLRYGIALPQPLE